MALQSELVARWADGKRLAFIPTIVYVLSTTCAWCVRNADSLSELARALEGKYRFVGINLDSPPAVPLSVTAPEAAAIPGAAPAFKMPGFPVYSGLPDALGRQLNLRSTPTTIVVSRQGVALHVWEGAYTGEVKVEIERALGVSLPLLEGR